MEIVATFLEEAIVRIIEHQIVDEEEKVDHHADGEEVLGAHGSVVPEARQGDGRFVEALERLVQVPSSADLQQVLLGRC